MEGVIFDVAIIGGGPTGIYSSYFVGLRNLSCSIIEANDHLGGQCSTLYKDKYIYDLPGAPIKAGDLINNLIDQSLQYNPAIFLNEFVLNIKKDKIFKINTHNKTIKAKKIIIALGAGIYHPIKLSHKTAISLENYRVFYHFNESDKCKDKIVAVLGGSDSAFDYVLELAKIAKKVYLIHRRDKFRGNEAYYEIIKNTKNIEIKVPYFVEDIVFNGDLNLIIEKSDGKENISLDYIYPCYGSETNLSFLQKWNLELRNNKIKVDPLTMKTSSEGIYAIGDCVTYLNRRNLLLTGFNEGCIAASLF